MTSEEPATPVTVTLPTDWRDQLDRAFAQAPHFQGAIGLVRQVVASWRVLRVAAKDVPPGSALQLDAWITTQWDEIGKDSDEYNGADWCRGGRDVLRNLTQFLAAGSVPVDPETTQPATEPLHWRTEVGGIAAVFCGTCSMLGGHEPDCAAGATQDGDQT